jgi:hypothetical protein
MGPLGITLLSLGSAAAFPVIDRLLSGSPESQMRKQLEIQDQFEQEKMARMGAQGGGDLSGLVGMQQENPMSLASLMADERETASLGRIARNMRQSRFAGMNPELEELLAGSTARLAAMQSERTLSPIEVLQMLEALNG